MLDCFGLVFGSGLGWLVLCFGISCGLEFCVC